MENQTKLVGIMTRIPESERIKIQEKAQKLGLSVSAVIKKLLEDWLNDNQIKLAF